MILNGPFFFYLPAERRLGWTGVLFGLLFGVFFTTGFAPFNVWPLALVGLGGLVALLHRSRTGGAAIAYAFSFAMAHHLTALYWLPQAFSVDSGNAADALTMGVPLLFLLCVYLSLYIVIPCWIYASQEWNSTFQPMIFAVLFVGGEFLRSILFTGFPWNLSGYIFANVDPILQMASIGGIWLLCLIAAYSAASLTGSFFSIAQGVAVLMIILLMGFWKMAPNIDVDMSSIEVSVVQPNITQTHKWDDAKRKDNLFKVLTLTREAARAGAPIIVWPETAIPYFIEEEPGIRSELASILGKNQTLVAGAIRREQVNDNTYYFNSIQTINNRARVEDWYDKHLLVPFGEYVPLRQFLPSFIQKIVYGREDYIHGTGPVLLTVRLNKNEFRVLPLICYEAIFPHFVARHAHHADVIVNVTNDGWYAGTTAPAQHFAMARVRAVETGLPLIRVGNTGITAIIGPDGQIIAKMPADVDGVLTTKIPRPSISKPLFMGLIKPGF